MLSSGAGTSFVVTDDVDWFEAAGNYVVLHVGKETHIVRETMSEVRASLAQLRPTLIRADSLMATATGRMDAVSDSIGATLSETRSMIAHLDSLALTATSIAGENRDVVRTTAENLFVISAKLEHFLDQVSRRPLRMLYGVQPLSDSVRRSPPQAGHTAGQP